jgi:hypothetical protein
MNQVEQWFSILQRKRFAAPNFADVAELEQRVLAFIAEWNEVAHPFNWTRASFDKVLAKIRCQQGRRLKFGRTRDKKESRKKGKQERNSSSFLNAR